MGLLDRLGLGRARSSSLLAPASSLGIASPWAEGGLPQIVLADILGAEAAATFPLSREGALAIPAVSKARNLLVSTIAKFPLRALTSTGPLTAADQPSFLYRTDATASPHDRMICTVDDGIFHGLSIWLVERGSHGQITAAAHLPYARWSVNKVGEILVDDAPVDEAAIILFNFSFDGLLTVGSRTLRGAQDTELAWTSRMRNPIALTELRIVDDANLTQAEADAYLAAWAKKHRAGEPSIGLTPAGMEIHTHGGSDGEAGLYLESRNAIRTDVGSFLNVRSSMLDGTSSVDSLTYVTGEGERNSFYEFDLPFWLGPIEARLSQDDVVPRGQRVRFDLYENYAPTPAPTGAPTED